MNGDISQKYKDLIHLYFPKIQKNQIKAHSEINPFPIVSSKLL